MPGSISHKKSPSGKGRAWRCKGGSDQKLAPTKSAGSDQKQAPTKKQKAPGMLRANTQMPPPAIKRRLRSKQTAHKEICIFEQAAGGCVGGTSSTSQEVPLAVPLAVPRRGRGQGTSEQAAGGATGGAPSKSQALLLAVPQRCRGQQLVCKEKATSEQATGGAVAVVVGGTPSTSQAVPLVASRQCRGHQSDLEEKGTFEEAGGGAAGGTPSTSQAVQLSVPWQCRSEQPHGKAWCISCSFVASVPQQSCSRFAALKLLTEHFSELQYRDDWLVAATWALDRTLERTRFDCWYGSWRAWLGAILFVITKTGTDVELGCDARDILMPFLPDDNDLEWELLTQVRRAEGREWEGGQ